MGSHLGSQPVSYSIKMELWSSEPPFTVVGKIDETMFAQSRAGGNALKKPVSSFSEDLL